MASVLLATPNIAVAGQPVEANANGLFFSQGEEESHTSAARRGAKDIRSEAESRLLRSIDKGASSRTLLEHLLQFRRAGQLGEIESMKPNAEALRRDWRWVHQGGGQTTLLAVEYPVAISIQIRSDETLDVAMKDLSGGTAVPRGFAGRPTYFGHTQTGIVQAQAMSMAHLARIAPEVSRVAVYFLGPGTQLVRSEGLPVSVLLLERP